MFIKFYIEMEFVDGFWKMFKEVLEVVMMVLVGKVNK